MRYFTLFASLIFLLSINKLQGQSNQSIHFDGLNDYIALDSGAQLLANQNAISMAGWFNADKLQYGAGMMGIRGNGSGTGGFYILQLGDGALECRFLSTTGLHEVVGPAGTIVANQWQHLALVYNGSSLRIYIDGVSIGSSNASGVITSTDKPFAVGKSLEGGFNFVYPGQADEVSLWTKALSVNEITDMISNELVGNETDLVAYYKFNHGFPSENNTSINEVVSTIGNGTRNAKLYNLELLADSSNFIGVLDVGIQAISFPQIEDKVSVDPAFTISALSSSGLVVSFEVISGPASISGNEITLTGSPGRVQVMATQAGNGNFSPAENVISTFTVIDALVNIPNIDLRNPLDGDFYMSTFSPILLAAIIDIDFDDRFDVNEVYFLVDGENVGIKDWGNKHYTAWWTPDTYGSHTFEVIAVNNYGGNTSKSALFNITSSTPNLNVDAFTDLWLDLDNFSEEVDGELPSYVGAFNQIQATLDITCPPGGCDPWDRVSSIEVKGHNGAWYQIIRYLTPYGVACDHDIDLTDFMSLLQGKVTFRGNLGTQGNGFLYSLNLDYVQGIPANSYSKINRLWSETYDFGNMSALQPCEVYDFQFETGVSAAKLKLVSTGHGWGNNNTGNAAEFHNDTHHIWIDGNETFEQVNWNDCQPNPDGCSPQGGTWQFDRAGWCPGSIAQWFDYDMTPFISSNPIEMKYIFDEDYVDLCHPSNPNCNSGVTCPNCDDGFNPNLIVKSHLISFRNSPFDTDTTYQPTVGIKQVKNIAFQVFPNPNAGKFYVDLRDLSEEASIQIIDMQGKLLRAYTLDSSNPLLSVDISDAPFGIYLVQVITKNEVSNKKVVKE
jgi:hypothetical protein